MLTTTAMDLILTLLPLLAHLVTASEDPTHIRVQKGWIRGNRHSVLDGTIVHEYLGIPMAKPPIGRLRFRKPVPVDPWPGTYNATQRCNACFLKIDIYFDRFTGSDQWNPKEDMSEDCLYINAWVPNPHLDGKKSIFVWIYGGGFYSGTSNLPLYDGRYIAATQNVIVISMQYRIGMLGFLALNVEEAPGNMGLHDQLMGLKWTQQNADFLNGDKNNVTIAGESAGSVSVGLHLISPLSRNLFHRAIMQSGAPTADWATMTLESSWYRLNSTIFSTRPDANMSCPRTNNVKKILDCLRNVPGWAINQGDWAPDGLIQFNWLPTVDYDFLIERPIRSLEQGNFKKCPLMIGSNANEGSWFLVYEFYFENFGPAFKLDELNFTINQETHRARMTKAFKYYPQWPKPLNQYGRDAIIYRYTDWRNPDDTSRNAYNLDQSVGDYHFLCPVNRFAEFYIKKGLHVYSYFFTHRSSVQPWGKWMGVMHGDEIMFMYGEAIKPGYSYTDDEKLLSHHMMQLWANFSKTGNPNGLDGPQRWPKSTAIDREYYDLSVDSMNGMKRKIGSGPRTEYCAFWDHYLPDLVVTTVDMKEAARQWTKDAADWQKYMVDWRHEYDYYKKTQYYAKPCDDSALHDEL